MRGIKSVVRGALAACVWFGGIASAQSIEVVPPSLASTYGGTGNYIPIGALDGGTYQVLCPASQLVGLPIGGTINSIRMRQWNPAAAPWPPAGSTITTYEIRIGPSTKTPTTMSGTFADNFTSPVLVRSGSLSLAAGAYPGGAAGGTTPEAWGPEITFSTPYTYTGGSLVFEFRNSGNGASTFADSNNSNALGNAVGIAGTSAGTTGFLTQTSLVMQLGVTAANTQFLTIPNANDTVAGNDGNSVPLGFFTDARHMSLYAADQFTSVPPGSLITGMQLRLRSAETSGWPVADSTNADYEIWLSQSTLAPGTMNGTYASNQLNPVKVRDGSYFLPAGVYPAGANAGTTPEGWGPLIQFQTPYVYQGGVMAIDIQSAGGIADQKFVDCVTGSATANGKTAAPRTSATGAGSSAFIVRLAFVPPVQSPFGDGVTKIYAAKQFADTVAGDAFLGFTQNRDFTTQNLFGPEQFQTVGPGTLLTGVAWRNQSTTAWPPALASYPQFDLRLSQSPLTPATMSTTVASNSGTDAITVRSGSLAVAAGSLAAKPTIGTAPFTWEVPFSQPYPYRSGTLDMLINNQAIAAAVNGPLDAVDANSVPLQQQVRGKFEAGVVGSASVPSPGNVPVTRYSADAQVMIPNSLKDGVGFGASFYFNSPLADSESTFQVIIGASQLSYVPVGGLITSVSMMGNESSSSWPGVTGANADDLSVEVSSAANPPQSMSDTFADNVGTDALIVRSGPISWEPGALPAGSTRRFGATITFDRGFVYKGGPLCLTFRHSGVLNGLPNLEAANPATAVRVVRAPGKTATSGEFFGLDSGPAIQLGYIPAGTTPKSRITIPGNSDRDVFGLSRTFQMLYSPEAVGVPIGATINGVTWRLLPGTSTDFPTSEVAFTRFDLWMSTSPRTAATASTTIATNDGGDLVQVRSGPLTIAPRSWSAQSTGGIEDWGVFIPFSRPFVYKGGTLAFTVRSSTPTGPASRSFEAALDIDPVTDIQGVRNSATPDAATGNFVKPPTALFAFTDDAFCPADLNNDGIVDDLDFQVFILSYNIVECSDAGMALGCPGDFNFTRFVDDDDFLIFVLAYNEVLCP
jgi:hypothetical protein